MLVQVTVEDEEIDAEEQLKARVKAFKNISTQADMRQQVRERQKPK